MRWDDDDVGEMGGVQCDDVVVWSEIGIRVE